MKNPKFWHRNKFKKILFFLLFLIIGTNQSLASNEQLKADWVMPKAPSNQPSSGIVFMEPTIYPNSTSHLVSFPYYENNADSSKRIESEHVCYSINSESCAHEPNIRYNAYVPVCDAQLDDNCIDKFWVTINGKKYYPILSNYMPAKSDLFFKSNRQANLPEGKSTGIWKLANTELGSQELNFAVSAVFTGNIRSSDKTIKKFSKPSISIVIDQVEIVPGGSRIHYPNSTGPGFVVGGCLHEDCGQNNIGYCAAIDTTVCAKRVNNLENIRYGIGLRIQDPPSSWVHGRILDPEFSISNLSATKLWNIEASPITLPVISAWISNTDYLTMNGLYEGYDASKTSWAGPLSSGDWALKSFDKWGKFLGEKAQALQSRWSFSTLNDYQMSEEYNGKKIDECTDGKSIAGIVSSNATVYQDGPPEWNEMDSSLDYKVSAPHLKPNSEVFLGLYQLKVNTKFAKCIFGIGNVPLKASISIVSDEGPKSIGVSTIKIQPDWIYFSASGFTFSSPTIKVKLIEDKKNLTKKKLNLVKSIVCIKGNITKKISGPNPKCPSSYQKK